MWNWKMRAAGFIGGLAVVFGFVALPAHSDESVTVPVPLVDAMAVSHFESAKRQKEKPGSVILALHAVDGFHKILSSTTRSPSTH